MVWGDFQMTAQAEGGGRAHSAGAGGLAHGLGWGDDSQLCGHPCRGWARGVLSHWSSPFVGVGVLPGVPRTPPPEGTWIISLVFVASSLSASCSVQWSVRLTLPSPDPKFTKVLRPEKATGGAISIVHCELSKASSGSGRRGLRPSEVGNQDGIWPW